MKRVRILLVEDETRVAGFIAKGLREQSYAVDIAADGESALYQAAINHYDLVILDVMLPLKNGHAVCRELRAAGFRSPILMLTARDAIDDRVAGLDAGADDYLVKPFDFKELLARLRALSRRSGVPRPDVDARWPTFRSTPPATPSPAPAAPSTSPPRSTRCSNSWCSTRTASWAGKPSRSTSGTKASTPSPTSSMSTSSACAPSSMPEARPA